MAKAAGKPDLPPLDWLRVFEAAGRNGSFTAAAEEFGSTQAAVSQRIRNLETWLGRQLFVRSARGVALTVEGESYLPLVQDALAALRQGTEDLFASTPRELRIGGLDSHLTGLLLPRIGGFLADRPGLRLVTDTVPKRSDFSEDSADLQLRFGTGKWPGRSARLLQEETLQPMAAGGFSGDWRELPRLEVRGERPGWREWSRHGGEPPQPPAAMSFDSMGHGLQAAQNGCGVVLGSVALAAARLADGRLQACSPKRLVTGQGYWLTWPDSMARSARKTALAEDLVRHLRAAG